MGKGILWAVGIAAIVIIAGVFSAYANQFSEHALGGPAEWGMFGDYVGGLANPLLSFLTIFLLIVSLYYQSLELAATRQELAQSKEALQQANRLQENNITLQTRNNLRPQIQNHFDACLQSLKASLQSNYQASSDTDSPYASIAEIESIILNGPSNQAEREIAKFWNGDWNSHLWGFIGLEARMKHIATINALISMIELSDSLIMIEQVQGKVAPYTKMMETVGLWSQEDLEHFRNQVNSAIEERLRMNFPTLHLNANIAASLPSFKPAQ